VFKYMYKDKFLAIGFWLSAFLVFYFLLGGFGLPMGNVRADTATTTATIINATPTVGAFTINGGAASITLIEGDNSSIVASTTVTITDGNGCNDIASVIQHLYRTDKGDGCSTNSYDCYATSSCAIVGSGNTCGASPDTSADYICSVTLNYYTDPTDVNAAASSTNWTMLVTANDGTANGTNSDTIEVDSLSALDVTTPIAYGSIALGADSTDQEQTITNTGNVRLDAQFSGTSMTCTTGSIDVGQQKYGTSTITAWIDAPFALSGSGTERDWDVAKKTTSTSTAAVHWMLEAPANGAEGTCSGSNTVAAVNDDQAQD
jgi:hypothetical protein